MPVKKSLKSERSGTIRASNDRSSSTPPKAGNDLNSALNGALSETRLPEPEVLNVHSKRTIAEIKPFLPHVETEFNVTVKANGKGIIVSGRNQADQKNAAHVVQELCRQARTGGELSDEFFRTVMAREVANDSAPKSDYRLPIAPRGEHQKQYLEALMNSQAVLVEGPAGTGKTFLSMAVALHMLQSRQVEKILLTRPAIGEEKLGFLPGDLDAKVGPYMIPLIDAAEKVLGSSARLKKMIEDDIIQFVPFAVMRGRNFDDAFVILDEAQNTTPDQMKMFLTRLGEGSRMVIDGDGTQCDLKDHRGQPVRSGLTDFMEIVGDTSIPVVKFDENDVVRSRLVKEIVAAYSKRDNARLHEITEAAKTSYSRQLPAVETRAPRGPSPRPR